MDLLGLSSFPIALITSAIVASALARRTLEGPEAEHHVGLNRSQYYGPIFLIELQYQILQKYLKRMLVMMRLLDRATVSDTSNVSQKDVGNY